jgi:transcriptional repressor NrdR
MVIEALKALDDVAFVRYASVYRDFSGPEDFEKVIAELSAKINSDPGLAGDV